GVFFHHVIRALEGEAGDRKGRVTFASLASHVAQEVKQEVPRLVGGGARQSPHLRADYTNEPVLLVVGLVEQLEAELREYQEERNKGPAKEFLERRAGKRIALWREAAEAGLPVGQLFYGGCL